LNDPDFNFVINSAPLDGGTRYYHWYISVIPRVTKTAGFELGSGMFINTSLPEENAEFLRGVNIDE
jgi:UDPglucose--hexose-1-phosphate uridylyltransferase